MYYVTSGKSWHYETVPKRQLVAGIILLGASEHQEMKIHKTWSLCQPQKALTDVHIDIWSSGTSPCQLASSEARTMHSWKPWHSFTGLFSGSVWLSLLYNASTAKPSLVAICAVESTWRHFHEPIWLECHQRGAWNKNGIGRWPNYFSPPRAKNRLGTRLHIALVYPIIFCVCERSTNMKCWGF